MIITKHTPPWNATASSRFFSAYSALMKNLNFSIEHAYPGQDVLLIDNTYLNHLQISDLVSNYNVDIVIILNLLDPPFPWTSLSTHLESTFPGKIFRYIGNESPDIKIIFWFLICHNEFTTYQDHEITPASLDYVFLNYNFKPHEHRIKLIQRLKEQNLLDLGYWTLEDYNHLPPNAVHDTRESVSHVLVHDLGNLDVWQKHFLNITSETVFRQSEEPLIITEKLFKPMIGLRPFVINGSPRYYNEFISLGFDCFEDIWPVADLSTQLENLEATMNQSHQIICNIVDDLSKDNLPALYTKLLPRLKHNRDLWYKLADQYTKQYTQELIKF